MDNPLFVKGMDSPKKNRFSAGIAFIIIAAAALFNHLITDHDAATRTTGPSLEVRLAGPISATEDRTTVRPEAEYAGPVETTRTVSVKLRSGETAAGALARVGVDPVSAGLALGALSDDVNMKSLRPGQQITADVNMEGRVKALRFPLNHIDYLESIPDASGTGFEAVRKELPTDKEIIEAACRLKGSLYDSFRACDLDTDLVSIVVGLLESQVDFFTDIRKGDTIRIVVEKESINGIFIRYGSIEGLILDGKLVSAGAFMHKSASNEVTYYDSEGFSVERPFLRTPLKYNSVTSNYSHRRLDPILHAYTPQKAVDYAAPKGTPVYAVGAGEVIFSGRKASNGNLVVIGHSDGLQSYYAHLETIRKGIRQGVTVDRRMQIGTVGATGKAKNIHLHFAAASYGKFVHPKTLTDKPGVPIGASEKDDYLAFVGRMTGRLKSLPVRGVDLPTL